MAPSPSDAPRHHGDAFRSGITPAPARQKLGAVCVSLQAGPRLAPQSLQVAEPHGGFHQDQHKRNQSAARSLQELTVMSV